MSPSIVSSGRIEYWKHWLRFHVLVVFVGEVIGAVAILVFSWSADVEMVALVPVLLGGELLFATYWIVMALLLCRQSPLEVRHDELAIRIEWRHARAGPKEVRFDEVDRIEIDRERKGSIDLVLRDKRRIRLGPGLGYATAFTQSLLAAWRRLLESSGSSIVITETAAEGDRFLVARPTPRV